jgi:hypothetical protein
MRKIFFIIMVLAGITWAADSTAVYSSDNMNNAPSKEGGLGSDVKRYVLFDETAQTSDTLATTDQLIIGPFPLAEGPKKPQYHYMNVLGKGLGAADSVAVMYQMTCGNKITDTAGTWTSFDTVTLHGGPRKVVVDLSTRSGEYLWLRFDNYTAGAVYMSKKLYLYLRRDSDN